MLYCALQLWLHSKVVLIDLTLCVVKHQLDWLIVIERLELKLHTVSGKPISHSLNFWYNIRKSTRPSESILTISALVLFLPSEVAEEELAALRTWCYNVAHTWLVLIYVKKAGLEALPEVALHLVSVCESEEKHTLPILGGFLIFYSLRFIR